MKADLDRFAQRLERVRAVAARRVRMDRQPLGGGHHVVKQLQQLREGTPARRVGLRAERAVKRLPTTAQRRRVRAAAAAATQLGEQPLDR